MKRLNLRKSRAAEEGVPEEKPYKTLGIAKKVSLKDLTLDALRDELAYDLVANYHTGGFISRSFSGVPDNEIPAILSPGREIRISTPSPNAEAFATLRRSLGDFGRSFRTITVLPNEAAETNQRVTNSAIQAGNAAHVMAQMVENMRNAGLSIDLSGTAESYTALSAVTAAALPQAAVIVSEEGRRLELLRLFEQAHRRGLERDGVDNAISYARELGATTRTLQQLIQRMEEASVHPIDHFPCVDFHGTGRRRMIIIETEDTAAQRTIWGFDIRGTGSYISRRLTGQHNRTEYHTIIGEIVAWNLHGRRGS
jgi:hypothetical protein